MELHYQEYGNKHAPLMMIFLHGGGVSSWMWDKQIEYFSDYYCVSVDLPEHGLSNDNDHFSIHDSAASINDLIEIKANEKKVIVIGFSLGAQVTIQMLSLKPELVNYAIINSALVRPMPFTKKLIRPSIKLTYPLIKNKLFSKLQARTLYLDKEYFAAYYKESCLMKSDALIRVLEENMSFQTPKDFKRAKGQILVTVGQKEKTVMKESAKDIVSHNPNCTGVIISNIGHGISLAKPEFFNEMIEKWIESGSISKEMVEIQ